MVAHALCHKLVLVTLCCHDRMMHGPSQEPTFPSMAAGLPDDPGLHGLRLQ